MSTKASCLVVTVIDQNMRELVGTITLQYITH